MAVYAAAVDAPLSGMFVANVERMWPGNGLQAVALKALAAQTLWGPIIIGVFLISNDALQAAFRSERPHFEMAEIRSRWRSALIASFQLWPLVHLTNFALVPEAHRVVFTASINFFWVAYLSIVANRR